MKLLLDQNLSYKLVADLQAWYPGTSQVRLLGMERADDKIIWDHARQGRRPTGRNSDSVFRRMCLATIRRITAVA